MEEQHEPRDQDIDLERYWMQDDKKIKSIILNGAQEHFKHPEDTESTELPERTCACIDERVSGFKLALPGSGILYGEKKAYEFLKDSNITSISSHEDCGAATLAFERLSDEEKKYYGSSDKYAQEFTENLAKKLGVAYNGHEKVETPGLHIARAIYYDASGTFSADTSGLPKGFTIDRAMSQGKDAAENLELAITIAMGEHGFGNKFSNDTPLVIIPINSEGDFGKLQSEISEVIAKNPSWAGRIKVDNGLATKTK